MAHIVCSAAEVAEAAKAVIVHIELERFKRDETAIANTMTHKHFFSRKQYTREDAIKRLDGDFFGWRSEYAYSDLNKARKLLLLAEHGDPVTIDEDSAQVLWARQLRN